MIAGAYVRKSTDQYGIADEEKSVTRQIEHATAYAAKKGWVLRPEFIYVDDGITGAEFVKRPGLARMMNALKPKPAFQVLVMSEESRLGREQIETSYVLRQIVDAGVRVFFYHDDREPVLDTPFDKIMLALTNFASEMERDKARQRTYDGMLRKAKNRHVTGGRVYGYDNVEIAGPSMGPEGRRRQHVLRRINEKQAAVIIRIFELYAEGLGCKRIADTLNRERVPAPRTNRGWATSGIREMLYRELYRGVIVWNRKEKIMRAGTKRRRTRPQKEWIRIPAPELRIVSDELWDKVHPRLANAREALPRSFRAGRLSGRPAYLDGNSPYLLTGFTRCAVCGGNISSIPRMHGTGSSQHRVNFYGCFINHRRGSAICANNVCVRQDVVDGAVLQAVRVALDERTLAMAAEKALAQIRSGQPNEAKRADQIKKEVAAIELQERRLVAAIRSGSELEPLVAALNEETERKTALMLELEGLSNVQEISSMDTERIKGELRGRIERARELLARHTPQARQILRVLVPGKLDLTPIRRNGRRGYRFVGEGTYRGLLSGVALEPLARTVVSPRGDPPVRGHSQSRV